MTQPEPTPWQQLAAHARLIEQRAGELSGYDPASLVPTADHDPLRDLGKLAAETTDLATACLAYTWQQLRVAGYSDVEIGEAWSVSRQRVGQVAGPRPPRARLGSTPTTTPEGT